MLLSMQNYSNIWNYLAEKTALGREECDEKKKQKKNPRNQVSESRARVQKTFVCGTGVILVQSSALLLLAPVQSCMLVGVSRAGSIRGYKPNTQVRNWMKDKQRAFFLLLVQLAAAEGPDSKR